MKVEGRKIVAGFVLIVCCAGPVLAVGALPAALAGLVSGAWGRFRLAAVLWVMAVLVVRRRPNASKGDGPYA